MKISKDLSEIADEFHHAFRQAAIALLAVAALGTVAVLLGGN